jgi:hypothetical protein
MAAGDRMVRYLRQILVHWVDERVLLAIAQWWDAFVDAMATAKGEAFLETQSDAMLDYTARNSGDRRILYRFPTPEGEADFRAYLRTRWARHRESGTQDALDYQTQRYGFKRYTWVDELSLREAGYTLPFGQPANGIIGSKPYPDGTWLDGSEPGPGTGFFAVILHPPHHFTVGEVWDGGRDWDDGLTWDFGVPSGYPAATAANILDDYAALIRDFRCAGSSLRHIVVDFVGDCVIDNAAASGYSGTNFVIYPTREPTEKLPDGTFNDLYNFGWK